MIKWILAVLIVIAVSIAAWPLPPLNYVAIMLGVWAAKQYGEHFARVK